MEEVSLYQVNRETSDHKLQLADTAVNTVEDQGLHQANKVSVLAVVQLDRILEVVQ